jgi:hypothetical protein
MPKTKDKPRSKDKASKKAAAPEAEEAKPEKTKFTVASAIAVLSNGNVAAKVLVGKRFPAFATATNEERLAAMSFVNLRRVEKALRGDVGDETEEDGEEETVEAPAKKVKAEKAAKKSKKGKASADDEDEELASILGEEDGDEDDDD